VKRRKLFFFLAQGKIIMRKDNKEKYLHAIARNLGNAGEAGGLFSSLGRVACTVIL
jgi:hypothetical protein